MNTISVEELEKIDASEITIVDVRPADQYSRGSFPGAVNIPLDEFDEKMEAVDKDKTVSLLTGLLIRNEISQRLGIIPSDIEFGYGEHGKPYVLNSRDYHFSVSHSGNAIVFVGDSFPVGIDIEQIADENLKMAKRFFTCNEYEYIINSKQLNIAFYKIWTSKEAYVKMLGLGLSKPLKSFDVLNESINCSFVTKRATEYLITVCSEKTVINDIKIEELPIERLLR